MNMWKELYISKLQAVEELVKEIKSNDICVAPCMMGEPTNILNALSKRENLEGVIHHQLLPFDHHTYLQAHMKDKIKHVSWFTTGYSRNAVQSGTADYMPVFYHEVPKFWNEFLELDVLYATVSKMDKHGYFSFGIANSESRAAIKKAKKIFLEVNENMPRTHGDNFIHISDVDRLCECNTPLQEVKNPDINEIDRIIGESIAQFIPDGATIQLGIGGIPNAIGKALLGKKDLGIHSEMFTEVMVDLILSGAVNNKKKTIHPGKVITTFAGGTKRMYDFLDDNPGIEFHPVDYVNNPNVISSHDDFISVNSCIEVDLLGQVCSESIGYKNYSGTGGQVDFVRGATKSRGGKSFIAMYSTAKKGTVSKIKPILTEGSVVTTSKNDVDYIATEFGVVRLKGKTAGQRAKALISIAHPDFQEYLIREALRMNLNIL
ncbi:MAG: 4-hydroxybutyrate--acetyl-CoA CoA transferase [Firmicutes bacterium HGW-Firmicutes-1]|jgi:acyl-CoA hydrolase|nr:MAG: 4-hydroxybutyrate--acetyl-CoA CoA transferase [Firmicutes bacterium HGW-Firmicutes-1]